MWCRTGRRATGAQALDVMCRTFRRRTSTDPTCWRVSINPSASSSCTHSSGQLVAALRSSSACHEPSSSTRVIAGRLSGVSCSFSLSRGCCRRERTIRHRRRDAQHAPIVWRLPTPNSPAAGVAVSSRPAAAARSRPRPGPGAHRHSRREGVGTRVACVRVCARERAGRSLVGLSATRPHRDRSGGGRHPSAPDPCFACAGVRARGSGGRSSPAISATVAAGPLDEGVAAPISGQRIPADVPYRARQSL